ncbi:MULTISPECIES: hypothetical protein [Pantoea]|uniref:hypothetical protein n=1 Tax=Pantoea TaxID=53335 RepID=UPI00224AA77B|nr:hypothetical protein [[Curtobacterium] plantarum]MCX2906766.1 hypothetical protein [[Curtobacterium] plantarum]
MALLKCDAAEEIVNFFIKNQRLEKIKRGKWKVVKTPDYTEVAIDMNATNSALWQ